MAEKTSRIPLRQRFVLKAIELLSESDSKVLTLGEYLQSQIQTFNPDLDLITEYIQELFRANGHYEVGKALALAAHGRNTKVLEAILNIPDVDPNYKDKQTGTTPFMIAAREGLVENMELLHGKGARIHQKDNQGNHALMYALSSERAVMNLPAIRYLLRNDLDPHLENIHGVSVDDMVHSRHSFSLYKIIDDARKDYNRKFAGTTPPQMPYLVPQV